MLRHTALLVLFGACQPALGVRLQVHETSRTSANQPFVRQEDVHGLREKMRHRFEQVDEDGDGVVSLLELKKGFGHEPVALGEGILRQMLVDCAGGDTSASSCTKEQMEVSLGHWMASQTTRRSLSLLQTDAQTSRRFWHVEDVDGKDLACGPSAETPDKGLEGVTCKVVGAKCFKNGGLLAWSLNDVCKGRTCICEATAETKRLAKVGLMGAAGVTTATNFSDPGDELVMPSCGRGWEGWKIFGHIEDVHTMMSGPELTFVKAALPAVTSKNVTKEFDKKEGKVVDTEVALYRSHRHSLSKDGKYGKICMMSWQATRSLGDWKTNLMIQAVHFKYAKPGLDVKAPKGIVVSYESTREPLKQAFEEHCCSEDFQADKVVISGHSHGGAMAELHALDVVANWECPKGRDLGAKELAVILVAPHTDMFGDSTINQAWSCNDAKSCLAGSVITMVTKGDWVGDESHSIMTRHASMHPATVFHVPCPSIPEGANYKNRAPEGQFSHHWCHGMYNYIPQMELKLVGEAGWGSSCDGACGDPNGMVQCNQWALMSGRGCSYKNKTYSSYVTQCPADKWLPSEERCDCHFDLCTELTHHGCQS